MPTNYVYCDESHVDTHAYRVQGGIWVAESGMRAVRAALKDLRAKYPNWGEYKWSSVSGREPRFAYCDLIDLFFASNVQRFMAFKCMVIQRTNDASRLADKTGRDLGFFKAYYTFLRYRLWHGWDNHVTIDHRNSPRATPTQELKDCLNNAAMRDLERPFRVLSCKMASSKSDDLLQLADVLCGAVGWAWNGMNTTCGAKPILHERIAAHLGVPTLGGYTTGRERLKFMVWEYRPKRK